MEAIDAQWSAVQRHYSKIKGMRFRVVDRLELPLDPTAAIIEVNEVFSEAARQLDMPLFRSFTLPACFYERTFVFILATPVTEDPATNKRYREGFKKLIKIGGDHGWGEYRTAPVFQQSVMDVYSCNNHALMRLHEIIKDAVDPNGILSAGRYAIWPRHLREKQP